MGWFTFRVVSCCCWLGCLTGCCCFLTVWLFLLRVCLILLVNSVVYYIHFTVELTFVMLNLDVSGTWYGVCVLFYDLVLWVVC